MKERKRSALAKENMIGILHDESLTETGTTEEEGAVGATAGVAAEAGARKGCEIGTGAGVGVEQEAEVVVDGCLFLLTCSIENDTFLILFLG